MPKMKNLFVLSALFLWTISTYGQEKAIDSTIVKQTYTKTELTTIIEGKKYPVYWSKNRINYFVKMIDKKTGREYWQLLEKSKMMDKDEN